MPFIVRLLLSIATFSLVTKDNFLLFLIALELIILATNINFIDHALIIQESAGLFNALILLAAAAVDTAIGLSLLIRYFNVRAEKTDSIEYLSWIRSKILA